MKNEIIINFKIKNDSEWVLLNKSNEILLYNLKFKKSKILAKLDYQIFDFLLIKNEIYICDIFSNLEKFNIFKNSIKTLEKTKINDFKLRVNYFESSTDNKLLFMALNISTLKIYDLKNKKHYVIKIDFNLCNLIEKYNKSIIIAGDSSLVYEYKINKNFKKIEYDFSNIIGDINGNNLIYNKIIFSKKYIFLLVQNKKIIITNNHKSNLKIINIFEVNKKSKINEMHLNKDLNYIIFNWDNNLYFKRLYLEKKNNKIKSFTFKKLNYDKNIITNSKIDMAYKKIICINNHRDIFSFKIYDKKLFNLNINYKNNKIFLKNTNKIITQEDGFIMGYIKSNVLINVIVFRIIIDNLNNYKIFNIINHLKKNHDKFYLIYKEKLYFNYNDNWKIFKNIITNNIKELIYDFLREFLILN